MTTASTIEKLEFRQIPLDQMEIRLGDGDSRTFKGYACRWDVVDSYQTHFRSRSFGEATREEKLPLLFMHSPDHPVGVFSWRETDEGLWIEGEFDDTPEGNTARIRAKSGSAPGLSVGFIRRGVDPEDESAITVAELREVSQITRGFASQPRAELVAVRKAAELMQDMDERGQESTDDEDSSSSDGKGEKGGTEDKPKNEDEDRSDGTDVEKRYVDGYVTGSYEERIATLRAAVHEWATGQFGDKVWVSTYATFESSVVATIWDDSYSESEAYRFDYVIADGVATLTNATPVRIVTTVALEEAGSADGIRTKVEAAEPEKSSDGTASDTESNETTDEQRQRLALRLKLAKARTN